MFQRTGPPALKPGLDNIINLCRELGNPQQQFKSIHVAGTNGKGSSSHLLAAVLQSAGYKTGLYTSPHIKDFRERIRVNGVPISKEAVVDFVEQHRLLLDKIKPSFFELTVAMAFSHFADDEVDLAVIEVGLGGRLDSTNIIQPLVSLITNIGFDHSYLLGNTLELIAREKAGIIKKEVPVVIGERDAKTAQVFIQKAESCNAKILFAEDIYQVETVPSHTAIRVSKGEQLEWESLELQLKGPFQSKNARGVLALLDILADLGYPVTREDIKTGFAQVRDLTGIAGRWQILRENPLVIGDTGHNRPAMEVLIAELKRINRGRLHMVLGFVNDKDISGMLEIMPTSAVYYFCAASVPRSLDAQKLFSMAQSYGIKGSVIPDPNQALDTAIQVADKNDLIFVGGSTFVVAELELLN